MPTWGARHGTLARAAWATFRAPLLMMPTGSYAKSADSVYVNLFVGSHDHARERAGTDVEMVQATDYPWSGKLAHTGEPEDAENFSLRIRVPDRGVSSLNRAPPTPTASHSNRRERPAVKTAIEKGYAVITRAWKAAIQSMCAADEVQRVHASEKIEDNAKQVALRYGPLVYNIEQVIRTLIGPESEGASDCRVKADLLGE
jgi:DUF1680 family protein